MASNSLLSTLALEPDGEDSWLATGPGPAGKRAFGGQLVAQALAASGRTVPQGQVASSLHSQFLRPGDAGRALRVAVERTHTGRSSATRRVLVHQDDRLLLTATMSFTLPTEGLEHGRVALAQQPTLLPETGPPGAAPGIPPGDFDIRFTDTLEDGTFVRRLWWRATAALPDDDHVHACVAVFITDLYLLDTVLRAHGRSVADRGVRWGTTDHSVWLHRPIRADRWSLLESRSPAAGRGRGVVLAQLLALDGTVTATLCQESLTALRT